MNPSPVYRTLELLVDEGVLLRTDLGSDRAYYEPARDHAHHHLVCETAEPSTTSTTSNSAVSRRISTTSGFALGRCEDHSLRPLHELPGTRT